MSVSYNLGPQSQPVIAFDVGGTWLRSAIVADNDCSSIKKIRSFSKETFPNESPQNLREMLVQYIVDDTRKRISYGGPARVGISMGAAMDHRSGTVWGSGPLWGDDAVPFDLVGSLLDREPEVAWVATNDVTAGLLSALNEWDGETTGTSVYLTVSTGIALRSWRTGSGVPVDDIAGIQGEIGHIPTHYQFRGQPLWMTCDCGGEYHLNAYCSGRGLERVLEQLRGSNSDVEALLEQYGADTLTLALADALKLREPIALEVLESVLEPLARVLLTALTVDPDIRRIFVGGGVPGTLGRDIWKKCLISKMERHGLYQISSRSPSVIRSLFIMCSNENNCLKGAAVAAQ